GVHLHRTDSRPNVMRCERFLPKENLSGVSPDFISGIVVARNGEPERFPLDRLGGRQGVCPPPRAMPRLKSSCWPSALGVGDGGQQGDFGAARIEPRITTMGTSDSN